MTTLEEPFELADLECSFNNLPDEMLELIISFLPPYKDLHVCMCVCKRWYTCSKNVLRKTEHNLYKAITTRNINWKTITPLDMAPSITKRFSHAACVHDNSMYIFGGCTTNSTSFNDLWRFDLSKRQWIRPLAMGTYPTPKAYATMIPYKECLILFGGWTYPLSSPMCQEWTMFSEIHFYNPTLNRWILVITINNPPPMAGHSAIIRDDTMIVFGGLYKSSVSPTYSSNEIWILDLKTMVWSNQQTSEPKPVPRYGQSLIKLNKNHLMVLGGTTKISKVYEDCWVLRMKGNIWTWFEITVKNREWSVPSIYCNPACMVGDKIVILSNQRDGASHPIPAVSRIVQPDRANENSATHRLEQNMRRLVDRDNNVNGRRGILPHQQQNNGVILPKCENSASPMVIDDEPKAGPSNECISANAFLCKLKGSGDGLNSKNLNIDQKENIVCPVAKENKSNNNHPAQNQHSYWRSKNGIGRKSLPNGIKIIRPISDTDNFRMAAFSTEPRIIPNIPQDVNQRRIPNLDDRQLLVRGPIVNPPPATPAVKKSRRNTLALHVLDISSVLNENCYSSVSWIRPQTNVIEGAPEEVIMYSLVQGKGELIMFGGLYYNGDFTHHCTASNQFSNSLHFITPPRDII